MRWCINYFRVSSASRVAEGEALKKRQGHFALAATVDLGEAYEFWTSYF